MLTNKDANKELALLVELTKTAKDPVLGGVLKALTLIVKLLLSMRINQVLLMTKMGVEKIKPIRREDGAASTQG